MLFQRRRGLGLGTVKLLWRIRHINISFFLLQVKQDAVFKLFVECRMKGAMRIVQTSKGELENCAKGKKMKSKGGKEQLKTL